MFFDLIGACVSLLSTYFLIRFDKKAWTIGMLATGLNGWLYWHKGIYADMFLEFFYFLSMCYGWYQWNKPINNKKRYHQNQFEYLSYFRWIVLFGILISLFIVIYYLLKQFTHSTVPILDAATTAMSLVAQWLMCHKIIFTWVLWFITDTIYAILYFKKQLPFHTVLMFIYMGLALAGYFFWGKQKSEPRP